MFSFKQFLSVDFAKIVEDLAGDQQQSQNYQNQISQMNQKLQRLLQLKAAVDQKIQQQSSQQQTQNNTNNMATQNAAVQPNSSGAVVGAPGGTNSGSPGG